MLPSHWAEQLLGLSLLLGLSDYLAVALSKYIPFSQCSRHHYIDATAAGPHIPRSTYSLPAAPSYPVDLVTVTLR
jgi:hypothetical protein